MSWIKENWSLLTGLTAAIVYVVSTSVIYGQDRQKIQTNEEAVKRLTEQQEIVVEIRERQAAQEVRAEMIMDLMQEIRDRFNEGN